VVEGEEQKMFLWILAIAVVVALTGAGVMFMGRLHGSRARGRCLSGLGVVAGILYTAIALYPWRGYDRESGLFVLAALPIAFIAQTVGAIMCLRVMVMDPEPLGLGVGDGESHSATRLTRRSLDRWRRRLPTGHCSWRLSSRVRHVLDPLLASAP